MKLVAEGVVIREVAREHPELRVWANGDLLHERNYEFKDGVLAFKCRFNPGTEIRVKDGKKDHLFVVQDKDTGLGTSMSGAEIAIAGRLMGKRLSLTGTAPISTF